MEEKWIYSGVQMSHQGKDGDKERKDEGQKTSPMEIMRDTGENKQVSDFLNKPNEVIIKHLILQALHSWVRLENQERKWNTGRERKDVYYQ